MRFGGFQSVAIASDRWMKTAFVGITIRKGVKMDNDNVDNFRNPYDNLADHSWWGQPWWWRWTVVLAVLVIGQLLGFDAWLLLR